MEHIKANKLKVSRVLHAGYVFECGKTRILFDPILQNPFSHNCYAFPDVRFDEKKIAELHFEAIFVSHFHDDHCCFESLNKLKKTIPIFMFCVHEEMFRLLHQLGFRCVYSLALDVSVAVNEFVITPRRALDADVDCLFQISAAGKNVLNVVDSWIDDETLTLLAQQPRWDLVLWPFQTMRELEVLSPARAKPPDCGLPQEWLSQLKTLNPRAVVPSSCQFQQESWSWYNAMFFPISYKFFSAELHAKLPQIQIIRLNPSVSIEIEEDNIFSAASLDWVSPNGDQNVDYFFNPKFLPPSTAEVAMYFKALSPSELQQVMDYCRFELPKQYRHLQHYQSSFFDTECIWELNVFDHLGQRQTLQYSINNSEIELLPSSIRQPSWCTDVIATKLYAALHFGECLTSMYLRINDVSFAPLIEAQLIDVELTEDPLVRSLFEGRFGAYQQAQLKRLGITQQINNEILTC